MSRPPGRAPAPRPATARARPRPAAPPAGRTGRTRPLSRETPVEQTRDPIDLATANPQVGQSPTHQLDVASPIAQVVDDRLVPIRPRPADLGDQSQLGRDFGHDPSAARDEIEVLPRTRAEAL